MVVEDSLLTRVSIKNGALPQFSYSNINEEADDEAIYDLAVQFMSLQPAAAPDADKRVIRHIETVVKYT